jgi:hypothetical protein
VTETAGIEGLLMEVNSFAEASLLDR